MSCVHAAPRAIISGSGAPFVGDVVEASVPCPRLCHLIAWLVVGHVLPPPSSVGSDAYSGVLARAYGLPFRKPLAAVHYGVLVFLHWLSSAVPRCGALRRQHGSFSGAAFRRRRLSRCSLQIALCMLGNNLMEKRRLFPDACNLNRLVAA